MVDWNTTILANWELINRLALRRFGESPLAEEAALAVMNQLMENDGKRLHGYEGRGTIPAFLAAVSYRLLEDFSRRRFGRRRAPLWIRHLGGIWLQLYTLLCLERLDIVEAVAMVRYGQISEPDIENAAWTIRQQVIDCGAHQGLEVDYDEQLPLAANTPDTPGEPVERFERCERNELFQMLFHTMTDAAEEVVQRNIDNLCSLEIQLAPEERLLLQLCYRDDIPVSRAGEMLGLNRHQVHGRLRRLLGRLRDDLQRAGIDQEILELLG